MTPKLRAITAHDLTGLARFCAAFPDEKRPIDFWQQRFRFWWEDNPAFIPTFPRGALLEVESSIVGMFALIPSSIQFANRTRLAANMSCWRVLPDWRGRGLILLAHLLEMARDYPIFNTTPTADVETILHRLPFVDLGQTIRSESIWIARPREERLVTGFKRICQISWNWSTAGRPANLLRAVGEPLQQHLRQATRLGRAMAQAGELERCDTIGPEFDRLWERTAANQTLTNTRNAAALDWYLNRNPNPARTVLLTHRQQGELRAFGLFARQPSRHHWPDREHLYAVDLWAEPPWNQHLLPLLGYAWQHAQQAGIPVLRIPHYHAAIAQLCAGIGLTRPLPKALPCFFLPPAGANPPDPATILPSRNMGDYGC